MSDPFTPPPEHPFAQQPQPPQPSQGSSYQGAQPGPSPADLSSSFSGERQMAMIIYILYLVSYFTGGVTGIVGVVLAYVNRDTAPDWLKSHYTFQIYTFWIHLLAVTVSFMCCFLLVGFLMLPAVVVWFVVRCVLGINRLTKNEAYPTPTNWIV